MTHGEQARPQECRPRMPKSSTILPRPLFDRDNGLRDEEGNDMTSVLIPKLVVPIRRNEFLQCITLTTVDQTGSTTTRVDDHDRQYNIQYVPDCN